MEIKAHFKLREGLTVLSGLSNPLRNIEVTHARIVPNRKGATMAKSDGRSIKWLLCIGKIRKL
jgi:hypothetical protein